MNLSFLSVNLFCQKRVFLLFNRKGPRNQVSISSLSGCPTSASCSMSAPSSPRGATGQYWPVWPVPSSSMLLPGQYWPVWPVPSTSMLLPGQNWPVTSSSMLVHQCWPVAREKTRASTRRLAILAGTGKMASEIPLAAYIVLGGTVTVT